MIDPQQLVSEKFICAEESPCLLFNINFFYIMKDF
jgi:hypothetical protein